VAAGVVAGALAAEGAGFAGSCATIATSAKRQKGATKKKPRHGVQR
jgi:hypothetical protein